jgi:hypothetical protein
MWTCYACQCGRCEDCTGVACQHVACSGDSALCWYRSFDPLAIDKEDVG